MKRLRTLAGFGAARIVVGSIMLLGACSFGPTEDPTRFYLLSSADDSQPAASTIGGEERINVGVGPFAIPGYLDRAQFVRRLGPNEVNPVEAARWAESLDEGFERVLAADLDALTPNIDVYSHPWRATTLTQWIVAGDLHRFETDASGRATLDVTWRLLDPDRKPTAVGARSVITTQSGGTTVEAEVAALSEAVSQFATILVEAIWQQRAKLLENR